MFQIIVGIRGIDLDHLSNQGPYIVFQQDDSYGFLNIHVIEQRNELNGRIL